MSKSKKRTAKTISITQLLQLFPDNESCIRWLEKIRWKDDPICNKCDGTERIGKAKSKPHTYWCGECRSHFSVTTGTKIHATKTPLRNWFVAIYSVMTARKGVSAMQLSKEIGVQYRTAWYMLHRIREACASGEFKLDNVVELDETYIGGKEVNEHTNMKLNAGSGTVGKVSIMGAKPVRTANSKTAKEFAQEAISLGSKIYTDDSRTHSHLPFEHDSVNHSGKQWAKSDVNTNSIESVWAVLKRSITGTWHHVSPKHLHRYVNEATMYLNSGNGETDIIDRMDALVRNVGGRRIAYRDLTAWVVGYG